MKSLALLLLLACGGTETPAADAPAGDGDAPAPAPAPAPPADSPAFEAPESLESGMDICLGNADCEAVQLSCCCGDDAVWVAANKSRVDDVKAKYAQKECGDCPDAECAAPQVGCKGGCKIKSGG